jgi:hypothetical protein
VKAEWGTSATNRRGSFLLQPPRAWDTSSAAIFQRIDRIGDRLQMFAGQVQVDEGVFQPGVAE